MSVDPNSPAVSVVLLSACSVATGGVPRAADTAMAGGSLRGQCTWAPIILFASQIRGVVILINFWEVRIHYQSASSQQKALEAFQRQW